MDALDREVDDYRVSLRDMMPERYAAPMDQMRITHTKAREATFAAYEPNDNSDANSAVMRFASTVTPVLGLLPL
jgi:hypothetical protein